MLLSQLSIGVPAQITTIVNDVDIAARLRKLGFEENAVVEVLHCGFPSHDPIAVRVEDHTIALGKPEAELIKVEIL